MEGSGWDEIDLFRAVQRSGSRALLIGRQALVALGLPVLTGAQPSLDDLIATKRFAARPKDLEDIRLLNVLKQRGRS